MPAKTKKKRSTTRADLKALAKLLGRLEADEALDPSLRDCFGGLLRSTVELALAAPKRGGSSALSTVQTAPTALGPADQSAVLGYALRQVANMAVALQDQARAIRDQADAFERVERRSDIESEEYVGGIFRGGPFG